MLRASDLIKIIVVFNHIDFKPDPDINIYEEHTTYMMAYTELTILYRIRCNFGAPLAVTSIDEIYKCNCLL